MCRCPDDVRTEEHKNKMNSYKKYYKIISLFSFVFAFSLGANFAHAAGIIDGDVYKTVVQSDGKVLIGGQFNTYNGTSRVNIARANSDGSLDTTFNPGVGTGSGNAVEDMAVQSDGKIIAVGWFTSYNGTSRNRIVRINTDGALLTLHSIRAREPIMTYMRLPFRLTEK